MAVSSQAVGLGPPGELHGAPAVAVGRGWTKFFFWHLSSF